MESVPNVLITGGYGCIGAATTKWLLHNTNSHVTLLSRSADEDRTQRVFENVDRSRLEVVACDVSDGPQVDQWISHHSFTRIAHLAGLQTPDCNSHRDRGLQTNLAGTQNLIEAMKHSQTSLQRFVFASSMAVYGPRSTYPTGRIETDSEPMPVNVYGVWKLAAENLCRLFAHDTGIATACLRPGAVFGPGRDAGQTAAPTTAMKQIALGQPYEIPYRNSQDYLYAPDVGAAFGNALMEPYDGFGAFTLPSHTASTAEMINAMQTSASSLGIPERFQITAGESEVPFVCDLDFQPFLDAFPNTTHTPLSESIQQSIEHFVAEADQGRLKI
ncbi:dTDP-L-rhamnose 4-epimerase [Rubripirellula lacrimiformis]|uniref:dTDP-L-rhamnose 4-epimerase n=1 Tax=Rubripirellula lacrimiformis TaxID=1930273 RepID=A0A517N4P8_9BACT|nr:NAD(P)-dependent oxidoreductase [Rubripirellula lacrimiformis]QDT01988.1 dTDP-L-rhamnose 4-epimerase [Rubripirellula lacrimiformis]